MRRNRFIFTLCFSMSVCSCSMMTNRTYLAEMENGDDEAFFKPREDFPVVPGDTGRSWRNEREIRSRTPASASQIMHRRENSSLESELARLESAQSEGAARHYQQYKGRLGNTSEKIYFLQLGSRAEREQYLNSRGLLDTPEPRLAYEMGMAAEQSELLLDMTKEDVISSWGRPDRVDIAGKASYENERWLYRRDGAVKYIYFESGKVGGWTTN